MPTKNKPYSLFGSYILFKRLEHDSLGELWRAAKIEEGRFGEPVALRRLLGGDRQALLANVQTATYIAPVLTGTTIVRNQVIGAIEGIPFVAHDYAGGRSLRHIVDRARGGTMANPQPIPVDQALAITEKVALSLESIGNLKYQGQRLTHGALIPQFVWVTDEGEIRTAGQQLGKGLVASLRQPELARGFASYFAPEIRGDGEPTRASDVYALGAILYLLLTGQEPPDALNPSFFEIETSRATLMGSETPIPDDIRPLLKRSLALDAGARYPSPAEMRQDLGKLLGAGQYAPTTFNLAFYLHTLLKKEMEGEALERDKEQKVALAPYIEELAATSRTATAEFLAGVPQDLGGAPAAEAKKSRTPLLAAAIAIAVLGGGAAAAYYLGYFGSKASAPPKAAATGAPVAAAPATTASIAPVIVAVPAGSTELTPAASDTTATDAQARQRALEEEINRRLQAEIAKLQAEYNRKLEAEQAPAPKLASQSTAAATQVAAVVPSRDEPDPSAAQLDAARRNEARALETATAAPAGSAPATVPQPQESAAAPAPAPAQPVVEELREGDLVAFDRVDVAPRLLSQVRPVYPPLAMRQRLEADILLTVLVTESGKVADVRILRGDTRKVGFDDAAVRAIRNASFSPATKEGKRVKVWMPIPIKFRL